MTEPLSRPKRKNPLKKTPVPLLPPVPLIPPDPPPPPLPPLAPPVDLPPLAQLAEPAGRHPAPAPPHRTGRWVTCSQWCSMKT